MSATTYSVDMADLHFVLFDQLDIEGKLKDIPKYADFDADLYKATLDEAARICVEVLHPINGPGDRQGCKLDADGNVTTPDGYREAWNVVAQGGWIAPGGDPEIGGSGLPSTVAMAVIEMMSGAAMAFQMYPGLCAAAARVLASFGPEGKSTEWAARMFAGEWGGTMCLTEADAGSSVGDNRAKATPTGNPAEYLLEGEKIFISGGDHDLASNIIHLILARTPDSPAGTKGLSLFVCPKFLVNDDGSLGERNGAKVVGIEEKMGIHGSATCTLALGADRPCYAWLVGKEHEGIEIMFNMMNEARIGVGAQGVSTATTAYQYARAYATERVQGTSARNFRDANAPRVTISEHPDVRRMLMTQKVLAETMRSFLYRMGLRHDVASNTDDPALRESLEDVVELLVPVLKSHCTDVGYDVAVSALQVYGGYGYIGEYPIEQLVRDAKIMSIYEGTNGIQAMDLLGRKLRMKGGGLFMKWMGEGKAAVAAGSGMGLEHADAIGKAIDHVGAAAMHLGGLGMQGRMESALLQASSFLTMLGTVQLALEALDQAMVAKKMIAENGETDLLVGKLLNLQFYVANLLPRAISLGKSITSGDDSALDPRLFRA